MHFRQKYRNGCVNWIGKDRETPIYRNWSVMNISCEWKNVNVLTTFFLPLSHSFSLSQLWHSFSLSHWHSLLCRYSFSFTVSIFLICTQLSLSLHTLFLSPTHTLSPTHISHPHSRYLFSLSSLSPSSSLSPPYLSTSPPTHFPLHTSPTHTLAIYSLSPPSLPPPPSSSLSLSPPYLSPLSLLPPLPLSPPPFHTFSPKGEEERETEGWRKGERERQREEGGGKDIYKRGRRVWKR